MPRCSCTIRYISCSFLFASPGPSCPSLLSFASPTAPCLFPVLFFLFAAVFLVLFFLCFPSLAPLCLVLAAVSFLGSPSLLSDRSAMLPLVCPLSLSLSLSLSFFARPHCFFCSTLSDITPRPVFSAVFPLSPSPAL